jgi:hypothetical protein
MLLVLSERLSRNRHRPRTKDAPYDCLARTPCGSARCGTFGYGCTEAHESILATAMAWYTPDTESAGMEGSSLATCEAGLCHDAWLAALAVPRTASLK